jgi:hypothetical protein
MIEVDLLEENLFVDKFGGIITKDNMEGMLAKLPHCKLIAKFAIDAVKGFAKSCPKNKAKATSQTYQQKQPSAGSYVHGAKTAKLYQSLAEPTPLAPQMYSFSMCCSMCLQVRCNCQK